MLQLLHHTFGADGPAITVIFDAADAPRWADDRRQYHAIDVRFAVNQDEADDLIEELIRKSAKTASARLQFCRLAFGAAGSAGAQIDLGDAQNMARGHIEDGKSTIAWNLPRLLLPKNRVKLLLNMMVIAQQTIPRGGTLTVDPVGEGDGLSFRVTARGLNARLPQNIADILSSGQISATDAHSVQPYYTRLLAESCGLTVSLAVDGEAVVVTAA